MGRRSRPCELAIGDHTRGDIGGACAQRFPMCEVGVGLEFRRLVFHLFNSQFALVMGDTNLANQTRKAGRNRRRAESGIEREISQDPCDPQNSFWRRQ